MPAAGRADGADPARVAGAVPAGRAALQGKGAPGQGPRGFSAGAADAAGRGKRLVGRSPGGLSSGTPLERAVVAGVTTGRAPTVCAFGWILWLAFVQRL